MGGVSILLLAFLYLSSYTFKFCEYHRMFLHYIVVTNVISTIDLYYEFSMSAREELSLYLTVAGIFAFIILYLYVKSNKKPTAKSSG